MSFANHVRDALPKGMTLPDPFAQVFDWCEAQGFTITHDNFDPAKPNTYALSIYPAAQRDEEFASHVVFGFEHGPPLHEPGDAMKDRFVSLCTAAGDGGTLGLWLDDDGKQRIVVFDHGDPYVLTDDSVVALKFLALGYWEPAAVFDFDMTPKDECGDDPLMPEAFRGFVTDTFGGPLPQTAKDLGLSRPEDDDRSDPARRWIDRDYHAFDDRALPVGNGKTPDTPFVITRAMQTYMDPPTLAILEETFEYVEYEE